MKKIILGLIVVSSVSTFGMSADRFTSVDVDILDTTRDSVVLEVSMCGRGVEVSRFNEFSYETMKNKELGSSVAEQICDESGSVAMIKRNIKLSTYRVKKDAEYCGYQIYRVDFDCEV